MGRDRWEGSTVLIALGGVLRGGASPSWAGAICGGMMHGMEGSSSRCPGGCTVCCDTDYVLYRRSTNGLTRPRPTRHHPEHLLSVQTGAGREGCPIVDLIAQSRSM